MFGDSVAQSIVSVVQDGDPDGFWWGFDSAGDGQQCVTRGVFLFQPDRFPVLHVLDLTG